MVLDVQKPEDSTGLTVEAWAEGCMFGALIIMACIALSNMRRHVVLHKLIILEVKQNRRPGRHQSGRFQLTNHCVAYLGLAPRHIHFHQ
jgi:hypothetical protein